MELPEGVKKTSGLFDPELGLQYFIAGMLSDLMRTAGNGEAVDHPNILIAVNEVNSDKSMDLLDRFCDTHRVLLDSGIFSLAMDHARINNVTHDEALGMAPEEIDGFDRLWERYGTVAGRFADRLWGVVELDQGGVANKPRVRARIEEELGVVPMPVYHPLLDGWDYYDELARGYDRICFGNIVQAAPSVRLRLIHTASERARQYPYLWTHLLGMSLNSDLVSLRLRGSCDSSAWLAPQRWMTNWRATSMLKGLLVYPSEMWYGEGEHWRSTSLADVTAHTRQLMIDTMGKDTHPWLLPSPA